MSKLPILGLVRDRRTGREDHFYGLALGRRDGDKVLVSWVGGYSDGQWSWEQESSWEAEADLLWLFSTEAG